MVSQTPREHNLSGRNDLLSDPIDQENVQGDEEVMVSSEGDTNIDENITIPNEATVQDPPPLRKSQMVCYHLRKRRLAQQFHMKDLGEASYVLGIQILRDRKNKLLALSQATYIDKILVRFAMQDSKKGNLPFRHRIQLSKEQSPKTP
ncbi:Gag/pol protein [Abeliophyllum distichum]|uniref:Gag/pol protein n=1 Tax=Abeliophyllum distichum TaxID=126358 RepID=A0ABD1PEC9_9LAMI